MAHPLRLYLPEVVYEFTTRTIQERYLLRPSRQARELTLGVIARAQLFYSSVRVYAFVFLSNHYHLLASAEDGAELAQFIGYVNSNVARELGRLYGWRGTLWGRRVRPIPILDDQAMIARLRYLLSNGVKERLVCSPRDWPGASAVPGLLGPMTLQGLWIDRDGLRRARARDPNADVSAFASTPTVVLSPLPPWREVPAEKLRANYEALVVDIEQEAQKVSGRVVGAQRVMRQDPHAAPDEAEHSRAPLCHTTSPSLRERFGLMYAAFVAAFRAAGKTVVSRTGELIRGLGFPEGSFPRPQWFVQPHGKPVISGLMQELALQQMLSGGSTG